MCDAPHVLSGHGWRRRDDQHTDIRAGDPSSGECSPTSLAHSIPSPSSFSLSVGKINTPQGYRTEAGFMNDFAQSYVGKG